MKSATLNFISATILIAAPAAPTLAGQAQEKSEEQIRYSVINLGTLGGIEAAGYGINNQGWVNGDADLQGSQAEHAFLWRNGVKVDLGTFGGPNSSAPGFPSDTGVIVGAAQTPEKTRLGSFLMVMDVRPQVPFARVSIRTT